MMRMRTKAPAFVPMRETTTFKAAVLDAAESGGVGSPTKPEDAEWEVRPGGMLVQKRNPDSDDVSLPPAPTIRVRVKYGSAYHEIYLSAQATFGELKKLVSARTGLHPQDQKLLFKDKERESSAYLDTSGVKDRSKIVLVEDPAGQARRFLEMRHNAKMEKAARSISQISVDVDMLAAQVSALESIVSKGKNVAESNVVSLTEQLMNQLIKLDGIMADGDVKLQRRMQVRRVQKYVEMLDVLKIKNSMPRSNAVLPQQQNSRQEQQKASQPPATVMTNWETFDALFSPSTSAVASTTTTTTTITTPRPRFDWELF